MVQPAIVLREHGERRVVAHAADRLVPLLHHRMEDQLQLFERMSGAELAPPQLLALVDRGLRRIGLDDMVDLRDAARPFAEGLTGGEKLADLGIDMKARLVEIDADRLAGTHAPLGDNRLLVELHHAGLGADDEQRIGGDGVAQRAQPVAVEPGDHPAPVGRGDRRRPVPRLHHRVAVEKKIALRLLHRAVGGEGGRNHQRLRHRRIAPRAHQELEDIVEHRRVGPAGLHHRLDVLHEGIECRVGEPRLVAPHPVAVARERVDLAVVRQHPERLRQPPGREGVGRIALMEDREPRDEARIEKIRIELRKMLGEEHALVDDRPAGEGAEIELRNLRRDRRLLDPPSDHVEVALEGRLVGLERVPDDDLLDLGARRVRLLADAGNVDRHLPPAVDRIAEAENLGLDDLAAALLRGEVRLRQEHLAHRDRAGPRLGAAALDDIGEEILRYLDMDARPVAGLAVGIDGAAMPHRLERVDRRRNDLPARLAVEGSDQPDTAGIVLLLGRVGFPQQSPVLFPRGEEVGRVFHPACSAPLIPPPPQEKRSPARDRRGYPPRRRARP